MSETQNTTQDPLVPLKAKMAEVLRITEQLFTMPKAERRAALETVQRLQREVERELDRIGARTFPEKIEAQARSNREKTREVIDLEFATHIVYTDEQLAAAKPDPQFGSSALYAANQALRKKAEEDTKTQKLLNDRIVELQRHLGIENGR